MPIHLDCPVCGQRLRVSNFAAGRVTKCTACGKGVRVPQPKEILDPTGSKVRPARFSFEDFFQRSIERAAQWRESLVDHPVRLLVLILLLVAGCLGVATTRWALSKPTDSRTMSSQAPVDPEPWEGVGMSDANDLVRVTAQSAATEQITVISPGATVPRKTPKAYLKVVLKIENLSSAELKYSGWSFREGNSDQAATLKDDSGTSHPQAVWEERNVGQTVAATIPPAGSIEDFLVFEHPGTYARYLKLTLPGAACGGTGELRIKIPQTPFVD